ncbi:hypothetical protein NHJ13051_009957 [Beauveria bassiana]
MPFLPLVVLVASAANALVVTRAPIPGYGVEQIKWSVEVFPGKFQLFNGTAEEVHAQALSVNPNFKPPSASTARGLKEKRGHVDCGGLQPANKQAIRNGAAYLRNLPPGRPTNGPGPNNCGRVSCSYNSGIWWCNDSTSQKSLNGWDWIGNSAHRITEVCDPGSSQTSGRNHEDGDWSTIVQGDRC